ncbi:hypothetical protein GCM10018953_64570 [Streptosporangium nondiastaticum]
MARAVAFFALGLVGYGLMFHLARVLYARGEGRAAALASVAGWAVALAAQVVLARAAADDPSQVVGRLALGSTAGVTAGGALLALAVRRGAGAGALAGTGRALLAAVLGGAAAYGAGLVVADALTGTSTWTSVVAGVVAALAGAAAFAVVAVVVDGPDARALLGRFGGLGRITGSGGPGGDKGMSATGGRRSDGRDGAGGVTGGGCSDG